MGNYDDKYKTYYSEIIDARKKNTYINNYKKETKNWLGRRIIQEFIGVLVLFLIVISCKVFVTPKTIVVYNYSKKIVDTNYNYSEIYNKVNNAVRNKTLENTIHSFIKEAQVKIKDINIPIYKIRKKVQLPEIELRDNNWLR